MKFFTVKVPPAIQATELGKSFTMTMCEFVTFLLDSDPYFNSTAEGILSNARIVAAFGVTAFGPEISLRSDDHAQLLRTVMSPPNGYPCMQGKTADGGTVRVPISRHLVPFIQAIMKARPSNEIENGTASVRSDDLTPTVLPETTFG